MIEVDITDFAASCEHLIANLAGAMDTALDKIGKIGQASAAGSTLYKGNGNLRKNIKYVENGQFTKSVVADTPYAGYVEFGNNQQGSIIHAKNAKALRFVVNGEVIFRKWVRAHGPLPFMAKAREDMIQATPGILRDMFEDLVRRG